MSDTTREEMRSVVVGNHEGFGCLNSGSRNDFSEDGIGYSRK